MDDPEPCLSCTLPDCDENDPRCKRRQVSCRGKWAEETALVAALEPGEQVAFGPMEGRRADVLQSSLLWAAHVGRVPRIRTRRIQDDLEDGYRLVVWREDPIPGRHWSRWGEAIDLCLELLPGEELTFYFGTVTELKSLQKSLCANRRHGRLPAIRTWRVNGDHRRLELHVKRE